MSPLGVWIFGTHNPCHFWTFYPGQMNNKQMKLCWPQKILSVSVINIWQGIMLKLLTSDKIWHINVQFQKIFLPPPHRRLLFCMPLPSGSSSLSSHIASKNLAFKTPPPPRNFQWPSMGWVWIFSGTTVEPQFNEVPRDWGNLFVISKVRYIKNLCITNWWKNNQTVCYIEVW